MCVLGISLKIVVPKSGDEVSVICVYIYIYIYIYKSVIHFNTEFTRINKIFFDNRINIHDCMEIILRQT